MSKTPTKVEQFGQVVEVVGSLVFLGWTLDQWSSGGVRRVLRSLIEPPRRVLAHRLPSPVEVSAVLREAEQITKEGG